MVARKKTSPARKKGQSEEDALLQRVSANRRERQRTKVYYVMVIQYSSDKKSTLLKPAGSG
jgi:hypothetical protein